MKTNFFDNNILHLTMITKEQIRQYLIEFGKQMKHFRATNNISEQEFADKIGIKPYTLKHIEEAKYFYNVDIFIKINHLMNTHDRK